MTLPAAKSQWSPHSYPFDTFPVLRSHALPHFVLMNAGDKLSEPKLQDHAAAVAVIFKINEIQATKSLTKLHEIYNSWVNAMVPSDFYSKATTPTSKDKIRSGEEREQGNAVVSGTLEGVVDIPDHIHARTEQDDGPTESDRGKRASDRENNKETQTGHSTADALDAQEIPDLALGSNPAGPGQPIQPSRSSMAISLPDLDTNLAAPSVASAAPAETIAFADAISPAVPALVEPTEVPLYSQAETAGKSVTSGKAPIGTSGQACRGPPTKIPTAMQTNSRNRADVGGSFRQVFAESGSRAAGSSIMIQNKTTVQESSASPQAGSMNKVSRHASGPPGRDSVLANYRAIDAGEMASHDTTWTTAKRSQAVSASHARGTGHDSGHQGKGKVSPGANVPSTGASALLDVPARVEEDFQSQGIIRRVPAPSLGLASDGQDTRTNEHSLTHGSSKSGGDGALNPPEQKRRRVARPSEGETDLSTSRIPRPVSTKIIDQMKPKKTPSLSHRRVYFAQDQGEDHPVASGSQGMTEKMPASVTHPSSQRDSGSMHTDNNEQGEKGRKSSKSGKKRRHSRRSLGETI